MSLSRILGKPRGRQSYASDSRWVLPTCLIGLEHEYEGVKNSALPAHTFADFWTYHEEGSLKDHGAEYVFSTPLFGADAYAAEEWLVSHAKDSGWKCTKRTGIHVHLDVRDLTVPQLAGLCILYGALEPILYRWVGDGRDSSHFCIPLYRADEALLAVCSIVRSAWSDEKEDGHSALTQADQYQRYAGFNLQALSKFGSIEFRHLQTTHDLTRIEDWINMIMSLKATALKLPESDGATVRMIERMGTRELLNYVFPAQIAAKLYTTKSDEDFFARGLPSARDIAVHGCGQASWVQKNFPKGEHKGFVKWIKESKKPAPDKSGDEEFAMAERDAFFEPADDEDDPIMPALRPRRAFLNPQHVVGQDFRDVDFIHNDRLAVAIQEAPAHPELNLNDILPQPMEPQAVNADIWGQANRLAGRAPPVFIPMGLAVNQVPRIAAAPVLGNLPDPEQVQRQLEDARRRLGLRRNPRR